MLSIAINVKNGEKHIARCLSALSRFEDVVLLDNFSTDKTLAIAMSYSNVRVFQHDFCGMGNIRNMVANFAKYDWVFFVDIDEIVSEDLVGTLLTTKFEDGCIYSVIRHNFYDNCFIHTSSWGNDWVFRIYNRKQTKFIHEVHESLADNGLKRKKINGGYLYHFPYENVSQLIDKMQFYSTLYAKQHYGMKHPPLYSIPLRALIMFFKCYIFKRGFLQGYEGLVISSYNAIGVFSKYIKLYELRYRRKIGIGFSVTACLDKLKFLIDLVNLQTLLPEKLFIFVDIKSATHDILSGLTQLCESGVISSTLITDYDVTNLPVKCKQLADNFNLDNLIYINDTGSLANCNLFSQYKRKLLLGKLLDNVCVY